MSAPDTIDTIPSIVHIRKIALLFQFIDEEEDEQRMLNNFPSCAMNPASPALVSIYTPRPICLSQQWACKWEKHMQNRWQRGVTFNI